MQFISSRFAGNALLDDILNDPDSGYAKLQPGSPADAVRPVQQALADLGWPGFLDPPVLTWPFADGNYSPDMTRIVMAYNHHHNIHFPPGFQPGLIDGSVGPRTLRRLDWQMDFFDQSVVAIEAKFGQLQSAGLNIAWDPQGGDTTGIVMGHNACMRFVLVDGTQGAIFNTFGVGAYEVHGVIFSGYMPQQDMLGMPISDEVEGDEGTRESEFELGTLRYFTDETETEQTTSNGAPPPLF